MSQQEAQESSFKKGMTLDQYLSEMRPTNEDNNEDQGEGEDLYETSRKIKPSFSKKLISFEIRESDEDNYDESN